MADDARDRFDYKDENGEWQTLDPGPTRIKEHIIDDEKWVPSRTVDAVLIQNYEDFTCAVCRNKGRSIEEDGVDCPGQQCVDAFRVRVDEAEANLVEIRDAGPLGKGVFAKQDIPRRTELGEYLGELRPWTWPSDYEDYYDMDVPEVFTITAKNSGNWTRFVNHNCNPNCKAYDSMYGRRRATVFRAFRDISADEQLSIHYGEGYFEDLKMDCECDSYPGPHQPGGKPALFTDILNAVEGEGGASQAADMP